MSDQLRVDYEDLSELDTRLTNIVTTMSRDESHMSVLAGAVGDERLANRITDYSNSWLVNRAQIAENIEWLRDNVRQIHTELAARDGELAAGLSGSGSGSGGGPTISSGGPEAV